MAFSVNECHIVGNLGADPTDKNTKAGVAVSNISVALNDQWKDQAGVLHEEVTWMRVVLWRGLAEVAVKYLKKGSKVYVSGRISNRKWTDDKGVERIVTELVGRRLVLLDRNGNGNGNGGNGTADVPIDNSQDRGVPAPVTADDIPF